MILTGWKGTKEKIVLILCEDHPLTAKKIYHKLRKKYQMDISYQAVHKNLKQLLKNNIISKNDKSYSMNVDWINSLRNFLNKVYENYEEEIIISNRIGSEIAKIMNKKLIEKALKDSKKAVIEDIIEKLDEWYSEYYDKDKKEIQKILKHVENKDVLELGCGTGRTSFEIAKYSNSLTSIDSNEPCVNYCKENNDLDNVEFLCMDVRDIPKLDKKYDVIISSWLGLHYIEEKGKIIQDLYDLLRENGKLIVIEAYPESEYVEIIDKITGSQNKIQDNMDRLRNCLTKIFGNIQEEVVNTNYKFPSKEKVKETFQIELKYEGWSDWTEEVNKKLEKYLEKRRKPLTIGEMFSFIVCKK